MMPVAAEPTKWVAAAKEGQHHRLTSFDINISNDVNAKPAKLISVPSGGKS
jgi:hypothetical protein